MRSHRLHLPGHFAPIALALAIVLLLLFLGARHAHGATRVVPDDYPTIQAAIDAAASNDTVFARAGMYVESLTLSGKDLTLVAESDSGSTILTTNGTARILDIGAGVTAATVISLFRFQKGLADLGAAIRIGGGSSPVIRQCGFFSNEAYSPGGLSAGGAVFVDAGSSALIEGCEFRGNHARELPDGYGAEGGAIAASGATGVTIRRSVFFQNWAQGLEGGPGGAIRLSESPAVIESCAFTQNGGMDGVVNASFAALTVRDCSFGSNMVGYGSPGIYWQGYEGPVAEITGNVLFDNFTPIGAVIEAIGSGVVSRNTIAFNGGGLYRSGIDAGPGFTIDHNIVTNTNGTGIACTYGDPLSITCNDVWNNTGGNYGTGCSDPTGVDGNISADPLFCDAALRDLRLRKDSPCAAGSSACGEMGALPVACELAGVSANPPSSPGMRLEPVHPNPSRMPIEIAFQIAERAHVRLEIYDVSGRRCAVLADETMEAGRHSKTWSSRTPGPALRPGIYLAALRAGDRLQSRRFVVIE